MKEVPHLIHFCRGSATTKATTTPATTTTITYPDNPTESGQYLYTEDDACGAFLGGV